MLPDRFHDIVASCYTLEQLNTCRSFADYIWGEYEPKRILAFAIIQQRECQLMRNAAPEGRYYTAAPGADAELHTMD